MSPLIATWGVCFLYLDMFPSSVPSVGITNALSSQLLVSSRLFTVFHKCWSASGDGCGLFGIWVCFGGLISVVPTMSRLGYAVRQLVLPRTEQYRQHWQNYFRLSFSLMWLWLNYTWHFFFLSFFFQYYSKRGASLRIPWKRAVNVPVHGE